MRDEVAIAGWGMTEFGKRDEGLVALAEAAGSCALERAGLTSESVDVLYLSSFASSSLGRQAFAAAVVAERLRLVNARCVLIEAACASGSVAIREAIAAIRSGGAGCALVIGAEKMTSASTDDVTMVLSRAADIDAPSFAAGLTFPGFFALVARSYFSVYGDYRGELADVVVDSRARGITNPRAHFKKCVTREDVLESRPVADPLRLLDCSPISDGAAALVLIGAGAAGGRNCLSARFLASEQALGPTAPERMSTFTTLPSVVRAARMAYDAAGIEPDDVDVAELHDCFSIAQWVAIEDLGFASRGEAPGYSVRDSPSSAGHVPINPSGGLLSRGHPIGATGVAQIIEIARQLDGTADNQIEGAKVGLAHNIGGSGGVASVTIMARAA